MLALRSKRPWRLIALVIPGCGWQHTMTFRSPSGKRAIEIWQKGIDNSWGARVELVTPTGRTVLDRVPRDSYIYFVHVYWSPDETRVGVVGTGFAYFHLACNTATGTQIPFEHIREEMAQSIRATYHLPAAEDDPIQWAAMSEAGIEFFRRHPEIKVTYH